jgi:hypothetical protein
LNAQRRELADHIVGSAFTIRGPAKLAITSASGRRNVPTFQRLDDLRKCRQGRDADDAIAESERKQRLGDARGIE